MPRPLQSLAPTLQSERRIPLRTRPRGRSALQEEQSHTSRRKILDAAEAAFIQNSYATTTVDDILRRAEVGRATFYRHFTSVFDVAQGLVERFKPAIFAFYDDLAALGAPSQAQIEDWIRHFLAIYRDKTPFMVILLEVAGAEPDFMPIVVDLNRQYIERLGAGIPAFRRAASTDPADIEPATGAQLLLQSLHAFCYLVVLRNWAIEEAAAVRLIARDLARFIAEYGPEEPA